MLGDLILALSHLPPAVTAALVGALVGGVLTAVGGVFSQFFGWRSLRAQLTHECEKDREERDQASKREVYFEAASYFPRRLQGIMSMLNVNAEVEQPELELGTGSKIHLFASLETIRAVSVIEQKVNALQVKVLARRISVRQRQAALQGLEDEIASLQAQHQQLLALARQPAQPPQVMQQLINWAAELEQGSRASFRTKARLREALAQEVLETLQLVMNEALAINEDFPDLILAIRRELKQPIDEQAFGELMRHLEAETKETLDQFLAITDQQLQSYLRDT